jgi:hypothetical protein
MLLNPRDIGLGVHGLGWPHPHASERRGARDEATRPHERLWGPKPDTRRRAHRAVDAGARPTQAADVAQARMFETILLSEIAELEDLVASSERRWLRRRERGIDTQEHPPEALARLRGRVVEAQRLLDALRARFLSD